MCNSAILQIDETMDCLRARGLTEILTGFIEKHLLTVAGVIQVEISNNCRNFKKLQRLPQASPAMPQFCLLQSVDQHPRLTI